VGQCKSTEDKLSSAVGEKVPVKSLCDGKNHACN